MLPPCATSPQSPECVVLIRRRVGVGVGPTLQPLIRGVVKLKEPAVLRRAPCVPAVRSVVVAVAALAGHDGGRLACHLEGNDGAV